MGKQLNFYMTDKDERSILGEIGGLGAYKILRGTFKEKEDMEIDHLGIQGACRDLVLLCRSDCDARIEVVYLENQGLNWVRFADSEVIQFDRCRQEGRRLFAGRFWFDERRSGGQKRAVFREWANSVIKLVKKNCAVAGQYYVAPDAAERVAKKELELGGQGL